VKPGRWAPSLAIVSAKLEQSESVHRKKGSYEASASLDHKLHRSRDRSLGWLCRFEADSYDTSLSDANVAPHNIFLGDAHATFSGVAYPWLADFYP